MKQIRVLKTFSSTAYGNFGAGDIGRVDDAFATHVVEELGIAEYVVAQGANDAAQQAAADAAEAERVAVLDTLKADITELKAQLADAKKADKAAIQEAIDIKVAELAALEV